MLFSSSLFLLYFFPVFLLLYFIADQKFKNGILLVASILFFAWGAPVFIFYLFGSVILDFLIVGRMSVSEGKTKRSWFLASVFLNLGLLLYFKYANFFVANLSTILSWVSVKSPSWVAIVMPIGISFITFQKLSYTIEVSRKTAAPFKRLQDYALYILMFPQILAGPIVRYPLIADQIRDHSEKDTVEEKLMGMFRFIIGLSKKVLIADVLGTQVEKIFSLTPDGLNTPLAWWGAIAYTFQIYFDFSGYSDMAIGIARMLGFRLPENFNSPYISMNITEFWRRWHITLSTWFRDYVFLPIAYSVSRKLPKERYFTLRADKIIYLIATSITFLLCGFWHGAGWTFIIWGAYQGLFLILDRFFLLKLTKKAGKFPSILLTFIITITGWVIFRSADLHTAIVYIGRMFSFDFRFVDLYLDREFWTLMGIAMLFSFFPAFKIGEKMRDLVFSGTYRLSGYLTMMIISVILLVLSVSYATSSGFNPFIYFKF